MESEDYSDYIVLYIMRKFHRLRSLYMSNQVGVEIDDNVSLEAFIILCQIARLLFANLCQ